MVRNPTMAEEHMCWVELALTFDPDPNRRI